MFVLVITRDDTQNHKLPLKGMPLVFINNEIGGLSLRCGGSRKILHAELVERVVIGHSTLVILLKLQVHSILFTMTFLTMTF